MQESTPLSTPRGLATQTKKDDSMNHKKTELLENLKRFDIYTKLEEDYKKQTTIGAGFSITAWVIIGLLILGEMRNFLKITSTEHLKVDTSMGHRLSINVDITFHALTCAEAHVDTMDVAGDNQLNVEHTMYKQRISADGTPITNPELHQIGKIVPKGGQLAADYCGSCFGAETAIVKCCNSCMSLKRAYQSRGWALNDVVRSSEQCMRESDNPYIHVVVPGEGCRINGIMFVNKVAGNFHIAHGVSIIQDGRHIHQFNPFDAHMYNISHTINSLSFGHFYPRAPKNPLQHVSFIIPTNGSTGLKQYFFKIVPTTFQYANTPWKRYIDSCRYTYTERFRPLMLPDPHTGVLTQQTAVLPGIFFIYDLQPFVIYTTLTRMPLTHLFTRLLAIVGGVYSVLGMADSLVYRIQKLLNKKI